MTDSTPAWLRLADGHHLYPAGDGSWRLARPGDRFLRTAGPEAAFATIAAASGAASAGQPDGAHEAAVGALRDALLGSGALVAEAPAGAVPPWQVGVQGRGPVAAAVTCLLAAVDGVTPVGVRARGVAELAGLDALVSVSGHLCDARWSAQSDACAQAALPWTTCHLDGATAHLGPVHVPGATAGYRDLRGRRLAASALADELVLLWEHLDLVDAGAAAAPSPAWPAASGCAVLAALLVHDLLAVRVGGAPASGSAALEVDLETLRVQAHPVLPLPTVLAP